MQQQQLIKLPIPDFVKKLVANVFCQAAASQGFAQRLDNYDETEHTITFTGTNEETNLLMNNFNVHLREQFPIWYHGTIKYHLTRGLHEKSSTYYRIR